MYDGIIESKKIIDEVRMIFFGFFFFYIFARKKFRVFFFMALAFLSYSLISYVAPNMTQGMMILILIGLFIFILLISYREINELDKTGKTAYDIFHPDKIDYLVFIIFLIAWIILRIVYFD